ncbi:hypothetical protein JMG10_39825 [Nostoc ellipsosporum NOK]|nr:hypothetical protein [Nostoc ellipsosporum NOK]
MEQILNLLNNIDFFAFWNWLVNLPLTTKIPVLLGILGTIVSLIVNLPKVYDLITGIIIRIEVKRFTLVERVPGLVDFQLNMCIHASHGKAVLKGIYLVNHKNKFHLLYNEPICLYNEPDNNKPSNKARIQLAMPMIDFEFTQFVENRFAELLYKKMKECQVQILGFEIPDKSFKCLTMAGRLKGQINGTNFSNIPLSNWSVLVEYGNNRWKRSSKKVLKSVIIDNNQTRT